MGEAKVKLRAQDTDPNGTTLRDMEQSNPFRANDYSPLQNWFLCKKM